MKLIDKLVNKFKKFKKLFKDPMNVIIFLASKGIFNWISDNNFLRIIYFAKMKRKLNLDNPQTFNEKLQWLKLYDRNPLYTELVDKYEVRKYIANTIGEEYLIPLIGVWDKFEQIDFSDLPNQFVLKCTHDSGGVVICKDKNKLDIEKVRNRINKCLTRNYYYLGREWPYKNVKPRIICEKYMVDEPGSSLKDYKFFCFDGKVKAMFVATDRGVDTRFDYFDMEFNHLPFMQYYKNSDKKIDKPEGFDEMVNLAIQLSKGIPHVRVDFYDIKGKIYFGELTFYHFGGFVKFNPEEYDNIFGNWIQLSSKIKK